MDLVARPGDVADRLVRASCTASRRSVFTRSPAFFGINDGATTRHWRRVWNVLIDFGAYPEWNPFLRAIGGEARAGTRLSVEAHLPGRRVMKFRPRVLRAEPRRELRWRGRSPIPWLFEGEHVFSIAPLAADRVRFSQREMFSGFLVPVLRRTHLDATRNGFEEMNTALKPRVEP